MVRKIPRLHANGLPDEDIEKWVMGKLRVKLHPNASETNACETGSWTP